MRVDGRAQANGLLTLSELMVEEELCLNLRGRMQRCSACRDVCPAAALRLSIDGVDVDKEKCTGCNSCLPSCPSGALRSTGFVPERFLQALSGRERVHIHCRGSRDEGGGIVIPCHGVLDARLLASAGAEGVGTIALHGLNHCEDCALGDARTHIQAVVADLGVWLGARAPAIETAPGVAGEERRHYQDQPHMSRRNFLRFGGARAVTQAADWLVPGLAAETDDLDGLPFFQADGHLQRPAQYQQVLVSRAAQVPWREGGELPFSGRTVTAACSGCLSCGERCPTGALEMRSTQHLRQLSFDPALCTDCALCEGVCPEQAISAEGIRHVGILHKGRSTLFFRQLRACEQCGTPFDPASEETGICPACQNEQDLDEEWLEMLSG